MIPHPDQAAQMLAGRLLNVLMPDMKSTYCMSDATLMGMLVMALADETKSGVAKRLTDITAMQQLLSDASAEHGMADPALLSASPEDYTLDAVNKLHDELTAALISLHAEVEQAGDDALNAKIWTYLRETAERHRLNIGP